MDDRERAVEDLQQAISRAAKLAWVFEHHGAWGWQREDPRRWGEKRIPDRGRRGENLVLKWHKDLARRMNKLVDEYLESLEAREDRVSPHGDVNRISGAFAKAPGREDRCPDCGTRFLSIGSF